MEFLQEKSGGRPIDREPIEMIFNAFDENHDGRVELKEFVDAYFIKQVEDEIRMQEL